MGFNCVPCFLDAVLLEQPSSRLPPFPPGAHRNHAGYGKSGREDSPDAAENRFNALSLEERRKFEAETLVNVGGRKRQSPLNRYRTSWGAEVSERCACFGLSSLVP